MGFSVFLFIGLQLLVSPLPASSYVQPAAAHTTHNNITDLESLLAFKDHVSDDHGILAANWTTDAAFCGWIGITCSRARQRVTAIDLNSFSMQGTVSPHLGNLSFLYTLNLGNNTLTGPIPESLSRLPRIRWISLRTNQLSGPIPRGFFNMSSLLSIYLYQNNLTGALPSNDSLIRLPRLQLFSLDANRLTGPIPSSLALCPNLQTIGLTQNEFTGAIPVELSNLPKLAHLRLSINQLTGTIPTSLGNLTALQHLHLNFNHLEGVVPNTLGNLRNLQSLHLGNNHLTGMIPDSLFNASMLQELELSFNNLTGPIPVTLGRFTPRLTVLWMSVNQLTGGLDFLTSLSNCNNLLSLDVGANKLGGLIPDSVGNLSAVLGRFDIDANRISGNIPEGFGNLSSLSYLSLAENQLTGTIPLSIASVKTMEVLYLDHNGIGGSIPFELGLMTSISDLQLQVNAFSGPIPDSLGNLSGLQHLFLSHNRLSSSVPTRLWSLSSLIELGLNDNALNGSIPPQIRELKALGKMSISSNHFSGNISTSFGELQMLTFLDLSDNSFQGQIPESLGGLINIEYLNLSHNSLSNTIPKSLASLRYIRTLDLSFNKLAGEVPSGGVFSNSSTTILKGNAALCGESKLNLSPCSAKSDTSNTGKQHLLVYVLPAVAAAVILFACFCLVLRKCTRSKARIPAQADTIFSKDHRLITYHELVRATDHFSDANLLGRGSFGAVYKACLDDGLMAAVKILNLDVEGASRSFEVECSALSMLRHRNLVKIISTCSNLDFKALILQFMSNGSLDEWLHSRNPHLSLLQRMDAMVDVSLALDYLHNHHHQIVVHSDVKPSNVLFDENMTAYLGDFGIAKLLLEGGKTLVSASTAGTIGYIAPEYGSTGNLTRRSDVYSFGILMLETFTGKRPTDAVFDGETSLWQWVSRAYPAQVLEIVDCKLLRDDSIEMPESEHRASIHQCLSSVIGLGLACSWDLPNKRLAMKDVVPSLQKIRAEYLSKIPSK